MDTRRIKKLSGRGASYPPRTLSQLMTVVALSGLAMAAVVPRGGWRSFAPPRAPAPPPRIWPFPAPAQPGTPYDHFIVNPREDLDPGMVVSAPQGIDDRMIAHPDALRVRSTPAPPLHGR